MDKQDHLLIRALVAASRSAPTADYFTDQLDYFQRCRCDFHSYKILVGVYLIYLTILRKMMAAWSVLHTQSIFSYIFRKIQ